MIDKRYSEACKLASSKKIIRNLLNPLIKTRLISLKRRPCTQIDQKNESDAVWYGVCIKIWYPYNEICQLY